MDLFNLVEYFVVVLLSDSPQLFHAFADLAGLIGHQLLNACKGGLPLCTEVPDLVSQLRKLQFHLVDEVGLHFGSGFLVFGEL